MGTAHTFDLGLAAIGEKGKLALKVFQAVSDAMFNPLFDLCA
jgi:hypothetical protein